MIWKRNFRTAHTSRTSKEHPCSSLIVLRAAGLSPVYGYGRTAAFCLQCLLTQNLHSNPLHRLVEPGFQRAPFAHRASQEQNSAVVLKSYTDLQALLKAAR